MAQTLHGQMCLRALGCSSTPAQKSTRLASSQAVKNSTLWWKLQARKSARSSSVRAARLSLAVAAGAAAETTPVISQEGEASEKADRPTVAEFARTVMALADDGSLCTIYKEQGIPLGTHVAFVLDAIGRPILALPQHSLALEDLKANSRCSLHVQVELPGMQKPQVTICGHATLPEDAATAMRFELAWSRKQGADEGASSSEALPALWQLSVEKLLVAADVDQEPAWIHADEYLEADADPLKDVAHKIVEDVNREHWQDLPRFCHAFAGIDDEVEDANLIWVDRLGLDLRVWLRSSAADVPEVREVRIPFAREAADEREARSSITMMAQVSWEKERNYTPKMPSLMAAPPEDK